MLSHSGSNATLGDGRAQQPIDTVRVLFVLTRHAYDESSLLMAATVAHMVVAVRTTPGRTWRVVIN